MKIKEMKRNKKQNRITEKKRQPKDNKRKYKK